MPIERQAPPDADSEEVAQALRQAAEILHAQGANPFRVSAYRRAADTIGSVGGLRGLYAAQGRPGLDALPGIGPGIAAAIAEILDTGRWAQLDRLRGSLDPAMLFRTVPGIGPELAVRIHDTLGVDTLEALESACYDGRLRAVAGVGARRGAAIRAALGDILGRPRWRRQREPGPSAAEPPVEVLLDVDREYREAALSGRLPLIAPRRFNPDNVAWLPVLHTMRDGWHFTALYSNTAQAHELGRTRDWVVLYFYDDGHAERQRTVVTEMRHGALAQRRVVRGRESECLDHYRKADPSTTA
jgi:hypothetical protein